MGSLVSAPFSRNLDGRNLIDPSEANWDELFPDLLTIIVRKLVLYEDVVAFGGVCKSWRSVVVKSNMIDHPSRSAQPPWLMLAEKATDDADSRGFVSLSKGGMVLNLELPEARRKWCMESMGWLITIDAGGMMELLHPLTRETITLPHLKTYKLFKEDRQEYGMTPFGGYVRRATLSTSPSATTDYAVMLIAGIGSDLVFWKPGDKAWNIVRGQREQRAHRDVIYYKNKFYAIDTRGDISVVCNSTIVQKIVCLVPRAPDYVASCVGGLYLVGCDDDLLVVRKMMCFLAGDDYWTVSFEVVKVGDPTRLSKWQEVNDLGGRSIFVGHNTAICVHSPDATGVKANCIYFTDDYFNGYAGANKIIGGKDMGIYNMETRKIEPLYQGASLSKYCPPIWVSPSF